MDHSSAAIHPRPTVRWRVIGILTVALVCGGLLWWRVAPFTAAPTDAVGWFMAWFYLSVSGSVGFVGTQALIRLLLVHWGRLPRRSWEAGFGVLLLGTVVGLGIGWVAAGSLARTAPWVLLLLWCGGHVTFSADALRRDHPTALD